MDHRFQSQTRYNDMKAALRKPLEWGIIGMNINPLEYINMLRLLVQVYNKHRMNCYLFRELDCRYSVMHNKADNKNKSVIVLALKTYLAESPSTTGINATFKEFAMAQIKLFIFAGHHTTSAGANFTYNLLAQQPDLLSKVRTGHDTVFRSNAADTASIISSKPQLFNQLPYTLAVIKETLRIYPTVAALRNGQPDIYLSGDDGQRFLTDHCI